MLGIHHIIGDESKLITNKSSCLTPPKVVGIVGHIGPYDPKSMEWSTYKGRFTFYLQANSITDAALKRATLLTIIGDSAYRMLADLHLPDELSTVAFDTLITDLDSSYGKKVSKLASRVRFQSISQHEGQSVDEYLAELRHSSIDCGFGDQLDNRLKDQFVVGLKSDQIKRKLLEDEDKSLADTVKRARDLELVNKESVSSKPAQTSSFSAHQVHRGSGFNQFMPRVSQPRQNQSSRFPSQQSSSNQPQPCYRCGTSGHQSYQCEYLTKGFICFNCQKIGHRSSMCFQPQRHTRSKSVTVSRDSSNSAWKLSIFSTAAWFPTSARLPTSWVWQASLSVVAEVLTNLTILKSPNQLRQFLRFMRFRTFLQYKYTVEVNGTPISMEVDSGSCYSLLNSDWWNRLGRPLLRQGPTLKDVSRNIIPVLGIANVDVKLNGQSKQLRVVFLDRPDTASLLGREWIAEFNLLSVHMTEPQQVPASLTTLLTEFGDLFDTSALPPIKGFKAHLHIKPNSNFKLFKPRPVPYSTSIRRSRPSSIDWSLSA